MKEAKLSCPEARKVVMHVCSLRGGWVNEQGKKKEEEGGEGVQGELTVKSTMAAGDNVSSVQPPKRTAGGRYGLNMLTRSGGGLAYARLVGRLRFACLDPGRGR